jgi:hypothetical protein
MKQTSSGSTHGTEGGLHEARVPVPVVHATPPANVAAHVQPVEETGQQCPPRQVPLQQSVFRVQAVLPPPHAGRQVPALQVPEQHCALLRHVAPSGLQFSPWLLLLP